MKKQMRPPAFSMRTHFSGVSFLTREGRDWLGVLVNNVVEERCGGSPAHSKLLLGDHLEVWTLECFGQGDNGLLEQTSKRPLVSRAST